MQSQSKNKPILPLAALLIGSQFYESWWREEALKKSICSCEIEEIKFSETEIQVILLRYCMHLIPGIGAGIWICTPKVYFYRSHHGHPNFISFRRPRYGRLLSRANEKSKFDLMAFHQCH